MGNDLSVVFVDECCGVAMYRGPLSTLVANFIEASGIQVLERGCCVPCSDSAYLYPRQQFFVGKSVENMGMVEAAKAMARRVVDMCRRRNITDVYEVYVFQHVFADGAKSYVLHYEHEELKQRS